MPDLIAKSPLAGQEPLALGGLTLAELALGPVTSVAPFKGAGKPLAVALKALKLSFPAPNRAVSAEMARIIWTGRDQAFLIGVAPLGLADHAALTDQSDGWAGMRLTGAGAADALMRLVPIDLRKMGMGESVRAPLGHMQALLIRVAEGYDILVFRSMAQTAWSELETVLSTQAARAAAGCSPNERSSN